MTTILKVWVAPLATAKGADVAVEVGRLQVAKRIMGTPGMQALSVLQFAGGPSATLSLRVHTVAEEEPVLVMVMV